MKPKPQSQEYKAFENLLGRVIAVPKAEIWRIEDDKREKRRPKSASRASDAPSKRT